MLDVVGKLRSHGGADALVIDGQRVSYTALAEQVDQAKRSLLALGARPGSRVGLLMPNGVAMIRVLLAAWDLGAVVVPMNARYRSHELRYVVEHAGVEILVTGGAGDGPRFLDRLGEAFPGLRTGKDPGGLAEAPQLRTVVLLGAGAAPPGFVGDDRFESLAYTLTQPAAGQVPREQLLIYTSGTTANPKGVLHHLNTFVDTARDTARSMRIGAGDVVWDPLPLFHTGGLLPVLGALDVGATFVTESHFDPAQSLALLSEERVTAAYVAFSTLITALLDHPDFPHTDLSSLRWILAIGPNRLLERVQQEIPGAVQVSCYGCTEIGGVIVYNDVEDPPSARAGTAGRPFPGAEVRIVDLHTGQPARSGQDGEIQVRGASVLRRYHREAGTVVSPDGWFSTGDLGRIDDDGQLVFEGRIKDMFKIGGENVAATEIEFVLAKHPAVTFAQVVSVPDDRLTEVAAAFVELRPGAQIDAETLVDFCRGQLASFKVPRHVRVVEEWPMSATKVQKFKLREQILRELGLGTGVGDTGTRSADGGP